MSHTFRTAILVIVLTATTSVALGASPIGESPGPGAPPTAPRLEESPIRLAQVAHRTAVAEPLTDDQQTLVDWATQRFTLAGLELPELTVRFDPSREQCGHAEGRYQHTPTSGRIVTICAPDADTFAAQLQARRTLLHELGHAWDFANLSDEDRLEVGRILGAEEWLADDAAWEDRGVERFAETFVFALLDQPRRVLKVSLDCAVLLDAFRTATGTEPLGPGLPSCAA